MLSEVNVMYYKVICSVKCVVIFVANNLACYMQKPREGEMRLIKLV